MKWPTASKNRMISADTGIEICISHIEVAYHSSASKWFECSLIKEAALELWWFQKPPCCNSNGTFPSCHWTIMTTYCIDQDDLFKLNNVQHHCRIMAGGVKVQTWFKSFTSWKLMTLCESKNKILNSWALLSSASCGCDRRNSTRMQFVYVLMLLCQ